jgi:hypothetical protein
MSESLVVDVPARFVVLAEPYPGLLPRLLEPFAKRDLTPDALRARREGEAMRVEVALDAVDPGVVHLIEGNLRQVVGTLSVSATRLEPVRQAA